MSSLNKDDRKQLHEILVAAFPTLDDLDLMTILHLGVPRSHISGKDVVPNFVLDLILWAEARGRIPEVIEAAREANPSNPELRSLAEHMLAATPARLVVTDRLEEMVTTAEFSSRAEAEQREQQTKDHPAASEAAEELQRLVLRSVDLINPDDFRGTMAERERAVCRIEFPCRNGQATGFLIRRDLVMTNYHVVEQFISKARAATEICCRFGYRWPSAHAQADEGVEHRLAEDWLVAASPTTELDYAILRLDTTSPEAADLASRRPLVPVKHDFETGEAIFIIQHPNAAPLKLSTGGLVKADARRVFYLANTLRGSSGSPCFNGNLEFIALHRSGEDVSNVGVPITAIVDDVKSKGLVDVFADGSEPEPRLRGTTSETRPETHVSPIDPHSSAGGGTEATGSSTRFPQSWKMAAAAAAVAVIAVITYALWPSRTDPPLPPSPLNVTGIILYQNSNSVVRGAVVVVPANNARSQPTDDAGFFEVQPVPTGTNELLVLVSGRVHPFTVSAPLGGRYPVVPPVAERRITLNPTQLNTVNNVLRTEFKRPIGNILLKGEELRNRTLWNVGGRIRVAFLDGETQLRDLVKKVAPQWSNHANVSFEFDVDPKVSDVRVTFVQNDAETYVGTDALAVPKTQPTLMLAALKAGTPDPTGTILHEFGHVLGLVHEYQTPNGQPRLNFTAIGKMAAAPPMRWSQADIDRNLKPPPDLPEEYKSKLFDQASVMMAPLPDDWFTTPTRLNSRRTLSPGDQAFIAKLYPRTR